MQSYCAKFGTRLHQIHTYALYGWDPSQALSSSDILIHGSQEERELGWGSDDEI